MDRRKFLKASAAGVAAAVIGGGVPAAGGSVDSNPLPLVGGEVVGTEEGGLLIRDDFTGRVVRAEIVCDATGVVTVSLTT